MTIGELKKKLDEFEDDVEIINTLPTEDEYKYLVQPVLMHFATSRAKDGMLVTRPCKETAGAKKVVIISLTTDI